MVKSGMFSGFINKGGLIFLYSQINWRKYPQITKYKFYYIYLNYKYHYIYYYMQLGRPQEHTVSEYKNKPLKPNIMSLQPKTTTDKEDKKRESTKVTRMIFQDCSTEIWNESQKLKQNNFSLRKLDIKILYSFLVCAFLAIKHLQGILCLWDGVRKCIKHSMYFILKQSLSGGLQIEHSW